MARRERTVQKTDSGANQPETNRVAKKKTTACIWIDKEGQVVIDDELLFELMKRWKSENRKVEFTVVDSKTCEDADLTNADCGPPNKGCGVTNTNCPCKGP